MRGLVRKREWVVIWPLYFDKRRSRSDGRRVSESFSVNRPTIQEIVLAIKELGLEYIVEEDKKHPSTWFESSGRILVKKVRPKSEIIKIIGRQLVKNRLKKSRS